MSLSRRCSLLVAFGLIAVLVGSNGCLGLVVALTVSPSSYDGDLAIVGFEPLSGSLQRPDVEVHAVKGLKGEGCYERWKNLPPSQRYAFGYQTMEVLSREGTVRILTGRYSGRISKPSLEPARHSFSIGIDNHSEHDLRVLVAEAALVPTEWYATGEFKVPETWKGQLNQPIPPKEAELSWETPSGDAEGGSVLVVPASGRGEITIPSGRVGVAEFDFVAYPIRSGYLDLALRDEGSGETLRYRFLLTGENHKLWRHFL